MASAAAAPATLLACYSAMLAVVVAQELQLVCQGHRIFHYKSLFNIFVSLWMGLRCVYWLVVLSGASPPQLLQDLLFWLPGATMFATFATLALFLTKMVRGLAWSGALRRRYLAAYAAVTALNVASTVAFSVLDAHFAASGDDAAQQEVQDAESMMSAALFVLLAGGFARLSRQLRSLGAWDPGRGALGLPPRTISTTVGCLAGIFASRAVWNVLTASSVVHLTTDEPTLRSALLTVGLYTLWELAPLVLLLATIASGRQGTGAPSAAIKGTAHLGVFEAIDALDAEAEEEAAGLVGGRGGGGVDSAAVGGGAPTGGADDEGAGLGGWSARGGGLQHASSGTISSSASSAAVAAGAGASDGGPLLYSDTAGSSAAAAAATAAAGGAAAAGYSSRGGGGGGGGVAAESAWWGGGGPSAGSMLLPGGASGLGVSGGLFGAPPPAAAWGGGAGGLGNAGGLLGSSVGLRPLGGASSSFLLRSPAAGGGLAQQTPAGAGSSSGLFGEPRYGYATVPTTPAPAFAMSGDEGPPLSPLSPEHYRPAQAQRVGLSLLGGDSSGSGSGSSGHLFASDATTAAGGGPRRPGAGGGPGHGGGGGGGGGGGPGAGFLSAQHNATRRTTYVAPAFGGGVR